jgi:peptidoglycan/LPS O-acetylase OafA/YrhL
MDEMVAAAPSLKGKGEDPMTMTARVITGFAIGMLLVWLYAAMRPRFGPGPKTAVLAAFVVWLCGFIFYMDWLYMGMMSVPLYAMVSIAMLIVCVVTALVGAMLYKEEATA